MAPPTVRHAELAAAGVDRGQGPARSPRGLGRPERPHQVVLLARPRRRALLPIRGAWVMEPQRRPTLAHGRAAAPGPLGDLRVSQFAQQPQFPPAPARVGPVAVEPGGVLLQRPPAARLALLVSPDA